MITVFDAVPFAERKHKLLTVRKQEWLAARPKVMAQGSPLNYNAAVSQRYYKRLAELIEKMAYEVRRDLERLFKEDHAQEFFAEDHHTAKQAMDASVSSQARILTNAFIKKFQDAFAFASKPIAEDLLKDVDKSSAQSLGSSLKELSGGLTINANIMTGDLYDIINASVVENVSLIKSIGSEYLSAVQGSVMRSITTGNGLADLVPFLKKQKDITLRRANLIALDQTRKATSALNVERMKKLGIKQYIWQHTGGSDHPRPYHRDVLNGQIFDFDNDPIIDEKTGQRGKPSQIYFCRCRMKPVINFSGE